MHVSNYFLCIQIYAACCIYFMGLNPEVVFCDLVSAPIPILRLFVDHVIYYCHHPDQLLSEKGGRWKSLYRMPLNYLEEITTGRASKIFVNSLYTLRVFNDTFKSLSSSGVVPEVLYPSINTKFFDDIRVISLDRALENLTHQKLPENPILLLSINRYERKKNLALAIEAFAELKRKLLPEIYKQCVLVMAGGYDKRVEENVEHYLELVGLADELEVTEKVIFLRSPSDSVKLSMINHCALLVYTPMNEHFGIVPLEAMYCRKPVIAQNTGGPTESVVNNRTGFLVRGSAEEIADRAAALIKDESLRQAMGRAGRERFQKVFSFDAFSNQLDTAIKSMRQPN